MIDVYSPEVQHWINVYGVVFSLLVLSLSINFTFFIKDKINRVLAIIVCITIITRIIAHVFDSTYLGLMEQDPLSTFMFKGTDQNIFKGLYQLGITVIAFIALIIRLFNQYRKSKE